MHEEFEDGWDIPNTGFGQKLAYLEDDNHFETNHEPKDMLPDEWRWRAWRDHTKFKLLSYIG